MQVRIVLLEPLRVAYARAISTDPETDAWNKLTAWARPRGLVDPGNHRFFGFNNPSPTPGSPVCGYEVWVTVGPEVRPEGGIGIKEFGGGLYAVARCRPRRPEDIPQSWQALRRWAVSSGRRHGRHQWLEEHLGQLGEPWDNIEMDLYYPLDEWGQTTEPTAERFAKASFRGPDTAGRGAATPGV